MPDPTNAPGQTPAPTPEADPQLRPPSATVEPFDAVGAPPVEPLTKKKHHGKGLIVFILLLVLLGAAGYYAFQNGWLNQFGIGPQPAATQTTPTLSPSSPLGAALQEADTALGDASTNLNNADTVLADKQGDLGE